MRDTRSDDTAKPPTALTERISGSGWRVVIGGDWRLAADLPETPAWPDNAAQAGRRLSFDASDLQHWDSSLLLYLDQILAESDRRGLEADLEGLPPGVRQLLATVRANAPRPEHTAVAGKDGILVRLGRSILQWMSQGGDLLAFVGEAVLSVGRLLTGRARLRWRDMALFMQQAGVEALPIVGILSLLIGMVLAFVGAVQLALFGAQIYVANLVGIGMLREMGPLMTAVIMAGRTGAAYAARLGTMQVNEEVDALRTLGISPTDFLVLPRLIALTLMMPLLCIYANVLGIVGGGIVSATLYDVGFIQYLEQVRGSVSYTDLGIGLGKSLVFGLLVASAGCYHGIRCGRSAAAVGEATTRAVVMSIVSIVLADSLVAVITSELGI